MRPRALGCLAKPQFECGGVPFGGGHLTTYSYGSAEMVRLVINRDALQERRSAAHLPVLLLPVPGGNHFSITHPTGPAGVADVRLAVVAVVNDRGR